MKVENANIRMVYDQIQKKLLQMIPEKWEKIYLYASILQLENNKPKGEMFFYYFPKSILKRKPVNSYEIPMKFNLQEEPFLQEMNSLYQLIENLSIECKNQGKAPWNYITIKMENCKFIVEYEYEPIISLEEMEAKRICWIYGNLKIPFESLSKKEKQLLLQQLGIEKTVTNRYEEPMYKNIKKTKITYQREENTDFSNNRIICKQQENNNMQEQTENIMSQILEEQMEQANVGIKCQILKQCI